MKIYNKSNMLFTGLALLCSFWLWYKGAPLICPAVGLLIWLAVQTTLNVHPTGDAADPDDRRVAQEKAKQVRHMPIIRMSGRYSSAFLPGMNEGGTFIYWAVFRRSGRGGCIASVRTFPKEVY